MSVVSPMVRAIGWVFAVSAVASAGEDADKRLRKLGEQLRDAKYSKQEKAFAELERMGAIAVPAVAAALPDAQPPLSRNMEDFLRKADPSLLLRVISTSPDIEVRRRLPKLISDEKILLELASTGATEVAAAAVRMLKDPAHLGAVSREAADSDARGFAAAMLIEIAKKDPSPERRAKAAAEIDDPDALSILIQDGDDSIRRVVVGKVTEPSVLKGLAESAGGSDDLRLAAVARISDAAFLGAIATGSARPAVRQAALARVDDAALLAGVARNEKIAGLRLIAVRRISDPQILLETAKKDSDEQVRLNAVALLKGRTALEQIAARDASADVRRVAGVLARRSARGRAWLQIARDLGGPDAALARDAAEVLKAAGPAAAPVLAETLADPAAAVAEAAGRELVRLGEKAILPVAAVLDNPAASERALGLLPRLSAKPIVAVVYPSGNAYGKAVQTKLEEALKARALLVECPSAGCDAFPSRVRIAETAADGNGCYDPHYFGGSFCRAPSQDVRLEVALVKGATTLSSQSFAASSPPKVQYTVYYGANSGPSSGDVQSATAKVLAAELVKLDLSSLDRLLEP